MRDKRLAQKGVMNLESMFASAGEGVKPTINLILKSDTNGSLEAINGAVGNMKVDDVRCLVIPPKYAYGNRKVGNIIDANSTLIFEVKLIDIIDLNSEEED